jgi:hypothetical protein
LNSGHGISARTSVIAVVGGAGRNSARLSISRWVVVTTRFIGVASTDHSSVDNRLTIRVRAIARAAGMDRKTIAAYVHAAIAMGMQRGGAPPSDEQLTAIAMARRPGNGRPSVHPHHWRGD